MKRGESYGKAKELKSFFLHLWRRGWGKMIRVSCDKITYRIPDLTLNFHIFVINELGGEFDTDCRLGVLKELILGVPGYEIGFSDTGVTDYDHCVIEMQDFGYC